MQCSHLCQDTTLLMACFFLLFQSYFHLKHQGITLEFIQVSQALKLNDGKMKSSHVFQKQRLYYNSLVSYVSSSFLYLFDLTSVSHVKALNLSYSLGKSADVGLLCLSTWNCFCTFQSKNNEMSATKEQQRSLRNVELEHCTLNHIYEQS